MGYIYDVDTQAVKDAQKDLSDIQTEEIKKKLQDEQDALDKTISELEKYKALWAEIPDLFEKQQNQQLATSLWGKEYESLILQNRTVDIENFKNNYLDAQAKINNNEELIKSFEEKKTYYNKLKDQWSNLSGEYEKQQNRMYAAQVMGADWESQVLSGRIDVMTKFGNDYVAIQDAITQAQWNATNERIKAYQAEADAAVAAANAAVQAERNKQALKDTSDTEVGKNTYNPGTSSAGMPSNANGKDGGNRYAAATASQRNNNTIMSNEQKKTIAASKKRANNIRKYANGGVVKINPDDLLTGLAKQHGEDGFAMVQDGERILTQQQTASFDHFVDLITGMNITPQMLMPDFMKAAQTVTNNNRPNYSVNMGDVVLNGVQNTKDFGAALMKYIPGEFGRQLCGRTR